MFRPPTSRPLETVCDGSSFDGSAFNDTVSNLHQSLGRRTHNLRFAEIGKSGKGAGYSVAGCDKGALQKFGRAFEVGGRD